MKPFRLSRRSVLRGAGVSLALPWLEAMTPLGRRAMAAPPKRFVVFFTPNGTIRNNWVPTGGETDFTLSRILMPLQPHRGDIVVLEGVDNIAATKGPGDDHMRGMGAMLTGTELMSGNTQGGAGTPAGLAGGISVDQELVRRLQPNTKFGSVELGIQAGSTGTVWGYSNYSGPGKPLPLDNSPKSVFDRLFAGVTGGDDAALTRLRTERKSVLDAVNRNYKLLQPKLGTADRQKLDAHLTAISGLEKTVLATAPVVSCTKPAPTTSDGRGAENFPAVGKLQMDLLTMALACDLTRVGTLQWSNSVGGTRMSWLGLTRGHHDFSHDPDSNTASVEALTKINTWYSEQFAYLIGKMKEIREESGTLLDNTLILWCNELSRGNAHSHPDMPFVLAGRAGGAIRSGRFLKFSGSVSHNNLLVSILRAFGVDTNTFGNPAYCTGPLSGLA